MVKTRGALSLQEDDKMDALTGVELGKVMLEGFHAGLNTAKEERKNLHGLKRTVTAMAKQKKETKSVGTKTISISHGTPIIP